MAFGIGVKPLVIPTSQYIGTFDNFALLSCARWYNKEMKHKATDEPAVVPVTVY